MVGYEFKRERFVGLHRAALRFPEARFNYIGTPAVHEKESEAGEVEVRRAFSKDPYGGALPVQSSHPSHDTRFSR